MKKALAVLLSMSMALALFGCGNSEETKKRTHRQKEDEED